jgi:hypothetical protein
MYFEEQLEKKKHARYIIHNLYSALNKETHKKEEIHLHGNMKNAHNVVGNISNITVVN